MTHNNGNGYCEADRAAVLSALYRLGEMLKGGRKMTAEEEQKLKTYLSGVGIITSKADFEAWYGKLRGSAAFEGLKRSGRAFQKKWWRCGKQCGKSTGLTPNTVLPRLELRRVMRRVRPLKRFYRQKRTGQGLKGLGPSPEEKIVLVCQWRREVGPLGRSNRVPPA